MPKQAITRARRIKHKGLRTGLTVAVAGAAIALPATAAVAMPTDYTKEVKVDNGDTLKLDGYGKKVSISDPEHGVTGALSENKPGPVQSRMDPNGTYTLKLPKPAAQADATPTVVYKHDGKTVKTFSLPHAPADLGR
ncbi:hypothetical protein [Streptomyces natalensis]|uniref:Uncharacterized protein n=1 Tax=Streptomyces natalensis ATCC 27448 TaxID=1240678 RepID=A0A0D7CG74_9ACTN|nr:hypothetical protein [Streptomyces natalensis]KIZ15254.1 hypothetical protein SNA_27060 [Streptomyces natalensis ATCC 27448]